MENNINQLKNSNFLSNLSFIAIIQVFFSIFIVVFFLKATVIEFYRVESGSMQPELYESDLVVLARVAYFVGLPTRIPVLGISLSTNARLYYREPKLGDVVVIDANEAQNINDNKFIIKRVTGLPLDTVSIEETSLGVRFHLQKSTVNNTNTKFIIPKKNDEITINKSNLKMYECILENETSDYESIKNNILNRDNYSYNLIINNNYYFVQGDNSAISYDSRIFGLVPEKSIIGKGIIKFPKKKHHSKSRFFELL